MFESYIRGVFYDNYSSCHQLHTVALSFLPYAAGKQQLEGKMPKIGHFHFTNRSPRDNLYGAYWPRKHCVSGVFFLPVFRDLHISKRPVTDQFGPDPPDVIEVYYNVQ